MSLQINKSRKSEKKTTKIWVQRQHIDKSHENSNQNSQFFFFFLVHHFWFFCFLCCYYWCCCCYYYFFFLTCIASTRSQTQHKILFKKHKIRLLHSIYSLSFVVYWEDKFIIVYESDNKVYLRFTREQDFFFFFGICKSQWNLWFWVAVDNVRCCW